MSISRLNAVGIPQLKRRHTSRLKLLSTENQIWMRGTSSVPPPHTLRAPAATRVGCRAVAALHQRSKRQSKVERRELG